ncbi:hypothetical protein GQ53DRAFT_80754 [Thozetella sp. PMI_491]|nr:hypothetical protein GQ53DRAFT_80754 [Thozetella sp. PMI_491]
MAMNPQPLQIISTTPGPTGVERVRSSAQRLKARERQITRSTAACLACRAKKRKCSGDKPVCKECATSRLNCEWPEPLKRGIPKHYIRALEARLHRTELLLRGLLPVISDDQLSRALHEISEPTGMSWEKATPEQWQRYPFAALRDVRAWQIETCTSGAEKHLSLQGLEGEAHTSAGLDAQNSDEPDDSPSRYSKSPSLLPQTDQEDRWDDPGLERRTLGSGEPLGGDARVGSVTSAVTDPPSTLFLSAEFQKEFLW